MKTPLWYVGIEVTKVTVRIFTAESRAGLGPHRPAARAIGGTAGELEAALSDALQRPHGRAATSGEAPPVMLTDAGRVALKALLARSALLAMPAVLAVLAPPAARTLLAVAGKSKRLQNWFRGHLRAPQPRLALHSTVGGHEHPPGTAG